MAKLKLQLLKEEAEELSEGRTQHQVLAGVFFYKAFDIENHRYALVFVPNCPNTHRIHRRVLDVRTKVKITTAHSHIQLLELCNALSRNLTELRKSQQILVPGLVPLLENNEDQDKLKLWLPSELPNAD